MPPPTSTDSASPTRPQAHWFASEVQAHDASLRSYLRGAFPAVRDTDDVIQDSYLRLWKACGKQPIRSARAFLFTIARRLALDHLRRDQKSPVRHVGHCSELSEVEDEGGTVDDISRRERLHLLAQAIAGLPPRCRDVFILYKVQGLSRKAAAEQLGLSEKTIESHTAHAMRQCEAYFRRKGIERVFSHAE